MPSLISRLNTRASESSTLSKLAHDRLVDIDFSDDGKLRDYVEDIIRLLSVASRLAQEVAELAGELPSVLPGEDRSDE